MTQVRCPIMRLSEAALPRAARMTAQATCLGECITHRVLKPFPAEALPHWTRKSRTVLHPHYCTDVRPFTPTTFQDGQVVDNQLLGHDVALRVQTCPAGGRIGRMRSRGVLVRCYNAISRR